MTDSGWRKRQIALDKKAENARELGLGYEPSRTIMEMAREAWVKAGEGWAVIDWFGERAKAFEIFAELVRADERNSWPAEMKTMERQVNILTDALAQERERLKWDVHSCGPTCKRYACVSMREALQAEREKSIQLWMLLDDVDTADDIAKSDYFIYRSLCRQAHAKRWDVLNENEIEAAIRARGNT
jgi:hypothetical protein